jgi:hypothetical protein
MPCFSNATSVAFRDERRTSNVQRPTSNQRQETRFIHSTFGVGRSTFDVHPFIRCSTFDAGRSSFHSMFDVRRWTFDVHLLFSSGVKAARPTEKAVRPDGAGADGLAVSRLVSRPATGSGV